MEKILIEVDEQAGKVFKSLTAEKQQKLTEAISMMLKKAFNDATAADYRKLLDEFGQQALANGLTEEELARLLSQRE